MPKNKEKTYSVVVATSGKTIDGREITADQIKQMAESYSLEVYGARIWLEHLRGLLPDSSFKAYGDVISLSTTKNKDDVLQLVAEISPSEDLVKINRAGQKIYSSVEMHPNLEKTNGAYLVGLAVTDSPASLGTQAIKFNAQSANKDNVLSDFIAIENFSELSSSDVTGDPGLMDRLKSLFGKQDEKISVMDEQAKGLFSEIKESVIYAAQQFSESAQAQSKKIDALSSSLSSLENQFNSLKSDLDETPQNEPFSRPPATGGEAEGQYQTDC